MSADMYSNKIENDNTDIDDSEMNDSEIDDDKRELLRLKRLDKNYHVVYRRKYNDILDKVVRTKVEIYTTNSTGSKIRNAETGEYSNYTVGSKYEELFFSVVLSTGECSGKYKMPLLFFTSPRHYEQVMGAEVSEDTIYRWNLKRNSLIKQMETESSHHRCDVLVK